MHRCVLFVDVLLQRRSSLETQLLNTPDASPRPAAAQVRGALDGSAALASLSQRSQWLLCALEHILEQAKAKTEELARKRADHEKAQAVLRPLLVRIRLFHVPIQCD